jgi:hypothetical protein
MVKEQEQEQESKAVAVHELLDNSGQSPDDLTEENAVGIRYTLLGNKQSVQVMWNELSPEIQRAAGLFGLKTRFTNDTSGVRNQTKNGIKPFKDDFDRQIQAVRDTVDDFGKGVWVDRTREPGAPRVDRDKLAEAIIQVMIQTNKLAESDRAATLADRRARLDSDPKYLAGVRTRPEVANAYNALMGRATIDLNDL